MDTQTFGFGLSFADLYDRDGLLRLDSAFTDFVNESDAELAARLAVVRRDPGAIEAKDESDLILALAPYLEDFLVQLFGLGEAHASLVGDQRALEPVHAVKRAFVQKRAAKAFPPDEAAGFDGRALRADLQARLGGPFSEATLAAAIQSWEDAGDEAALDLALRYAAWAVHSRAGRHAHRDGTLFRLPVKHDPFALVETETTEVAGHQALCGPAEARRVRDGFALTDHGADLARAMGEVQYCILCHHQGKDSCRHGLRDKQTGDFATNAHGRLTTGCPLEEKISEMQEAKRAGLPIAALGIVAVDNPMVAGTGHRICNDCMAACVYQNQHRDPVNIPQVETRVLKDVLGLPFGFEILSLLTRWNPFNLARPVPRRPSGYSVLVGGLGPAGYTLAHHLLNEGHTVVAVDGLKIEPLGSRLNGVTETGERVAFEPIEDASTLFEPLDRRLTEGFGGVAEYGITVRWDKNFLKLNRLLLERRAAFRLYGGVRLGGTITLDEAFAMGFDHVSLCLGAGKPTILDIPNNLARGVRQASDFLMALQLTGAGRADSVANLQVRLPVAVIGGGLTAIDTATEALAYYPVQVEKFLARFETLAAEIGEDTARARWTAEEAEIAEEFLAHARAIRAERAAAEREGRAPDLAGLLEGWGGATLLYRRALTESPAYRNNHEEVAKAFEEGLKVIEKVSPTAVVVDETGHARALAIKHGETGAETEFPARTVLVAAGTVPNVTLAREAGVPTLDGRFFQAVDENGNPVSPERRNKPSAVEVLCHVRDDGRTVSFLGDQHPSFAGNVVGAMGSAKQAAPVIDAVIRKAGAAGVAGEALIAALDKDLRAVVHKVERLTHNIVEVVVQAPLAARNFRPGQFYRLQNFETHALKVEGTTLGMEGVALTGAWVDPDRGLLGMIALEMGGSSDLIAHLRAGEPVVVMGPTGKPTEIPKGETVLLAGGGLGNAVLFSIGAALRAAGSRVLYFAGYKDSRDRFKVAEVEAASDVVVWGCDTGAPIAPNRLQDKSFVGNIVQAMAAYATGELGETAIGLDEVDRVIVIGSDRMMAAVGAARHAVLEPFMKADHVGIASINAPMQCMMKEICAQCLTAHVDPETGERTVVFSCSDQDQPIDVVDFASLRDRLGQNTVQEKLTAQWIDRCLKRTGRR